jgi:O-antigen/teichoic acid export membrane protein
MAIAAAVKQRLSIAMKLRRAVSQRMRELALLDQALVSGGNFVAAVLLAREFGIYEFGRITLAWMLVEFLASLQMSAIIQPMLNIGPKQAAGFVERYFQAVAAQQAIASVAMGLAIGLVTAISGVFVAGIGTFAAPLAVAVIVYQLHNFFRRYLFARDRPLGALCVDSIRFFVQISATIMLPIAVPHPMAEAGILIVAGACAVSAVLGAVQFGRVRWDAGAFREVTTRHWNFSKWLLPSAVMYWTTSQGFNVASGIVLGAAATGSLKAAISVVGILNILLLALDNFAPVQASRALYTGGDAALINYIGRLSFMTLGMAGTVVGVLNLAPGFFVHLLYGAEYDGIDYLVRWLSGASSLYAIGTVLIVWAGAMERTRTIFVSYAVATAFTIVATYPLTRYGGLIGVAIGSLMEEAIRIVALLIPFLRWLDAAKYDLATRSVPPKA